MKEHPFLYLVIFRESYFLVKMALIIHHAI